MQLQQQQQQQLAAGAGACAEAAQKTKLQIVDKSEKAANFISTAKAATK